MQKPPSHPVIPPAAAMAAASALNQEAATTAAKAAGELFAASMVSDMLGYIGQEVAAGRFSAQYEFPAPPDLSATACNFAELALKEAFISAGYTVVVGRSPRHRTGTQSFDVRVGWRSSDEMPHGR